MDKPRTRYTTGQEPALAYQVLGEGGGIDIVLVPPLFSHVEYLWNHPPVARTLRRLAGLGRLVLYDRRGVSMSDHSPGPYTLGDEAGDLRW